MRQEFCVRRSRNFGLEELTITTRARIAPFTYAMLVFAAIIGYLVFGTFPDVATWVGIALIVGAGLFIAQRERRAASGG